MSRFLFFGRVTVYHNNGQYKTWIFGSSEMQLCQACWLEGCEGFFWSRLDLSAQHTFPTFDLSCISRGAQDGVGCEQRVWKGACPTSTHISINFHPHISKECPKKIDERRTSHNPTSFQVRRLMLRMNLFVSETQSFQETKMNANHFKPWFPFQSRHSLPTQGHPTPRNTKFARLERIFTTLFPGRSQNLYFVTGWLWVTDFVRRPHFENFEPLNSLWSNLSTMEPGKAEQLWI